MITICMKPSTDLVIGFLIKSSVLQTVGHLYLGSHCSNMKEKLLHLLTLSIIPPAGPCSDLLGLKTNAQTSDHRLSLVRSIAAQSQWAHVAQPMWIVRALCETTFLVPFLASSVC